MSKYSQEKIDTALLAYWLEGGNEKRATHHCDVPAGTIREWALKTHTARLTQLVEQNAPELTKSILRKQEAIQLKALDLVHDLLDDTGKKLEAGELRSPDQAAQRVATTLGIITDKWRLLQELPTQIVGTQEASDHLRALQQRFPWLVVDSTAEEVPNPELAEHT